MDGDSHRLRLAWARNRRQRHVCRIRRLWLHVLEDMLHPVALEELEATRRLLGCRLVPARRRLVVDGLEVLLCLPNSDIVHPDGHVNTRHPAVKHQPLGNATLSILHGRGVEKDFADALDAWEKLDCAPARIAHVVVDAVVQRNSRLLVVPAVEEKCIIA